MIAAEAVAAQGSVSWSDVQVEHLRTLLTLPPEEKLRRFDAMTVATFAPGSGVDSLAQLHPRQSLWIKRFLDGQQHWSNADWLSVLWMAREGGCHL